MYAKYVYLNTSTIEQIHDDIFEIFCGETNVNNLSASCDTSLSEILTTYSTSPWVDFDDVSSTERIMRMEMSDDAGVYKYVGWHHDGADDLGFAIMESWDAGTNTPTNEVAVNYDKEGMRSFPSVGGTMHIYSSQFCTVFTHQSTADLWGGQSGDATWGSLGIFEMTRDHPSLAVGEGFPNWVMSSTAMFWGDSDATMSAHMWKGRDSNNVVLTPFEVELFYPGRDSFAYSDTNSYPITGALGTSTALTGIGAPTTFGLEPIGVGGAFATGTASDAETYYGSISDRCDIWMMPVGSEGCGDLVIVDGLPYIVFKAGYTTSTAGKEHGGKFIVPYG